MWGIRRERERESAYNLPHPSTDNNEELFPPAILVLVRSPVRKTPHMSYIMASAQCTESSESRRNGCTQNSESRRNGCRIKKEREYM